MIRIADKHDLRAKRLHLQAQNRRFGETLVEIHVADWPDAARAHAEKPDRAWQSRHFSVQLWIDKQTGQERLSVCRTAILADGNWRDGITWDELERIKAQAGFADRWAVEVYPPTNDVVNVANFRHLWLLNEAPPFAWKKKIHDAIIQRPPASKAAAAHP